MKKLFALGCSFFVFSLPLLAQETFTLTTYYPAPFGVYNELRSRHMAIGDNFYQQSAYSWTPTGSAQRIAQDADLVVEGNVGIGTHNPLRELHIRATDLASGNANILLEGVKTAGNTTAGVWNLRAMGDTVAADKQGALIFTSWDDARLSTWLSDPVVIEKGAANDSLRIDKLGNVGIGTATPQGVLDVTSTTGGLIPPRMTTAQRTAIADPVAGTMIYNTDYNTVEFYDGAQWKFSAPKVYDSGWFAVDTDVHGQYSLTPNLANIVSGKVPDNIQIFFRETAGGPVFPVPVMSKPYFYFGDYRDNFVWGGIVSWNNATNTASLNFCGKEGSCVGASSSAPGKNVWNAPPLGAAETKELHPRGYYRIVASFYSD